MKTGIVIFTLTMAFIIFVAIMAKNAHAKPAESQVGYASRTFFGLGLPGTF